MGFPLFDACIFLLLFCMNLCIFRMYLSVLSYIYIYIYIYIYSSTIFYVCICFNMYTVRNFYVA
jgi:hypothetical protein